MLGSRCALAAIAAPLLAAAEPAAAPPPADPAPLAAERRGEAGLHGDVRALLASAPGLGTIRGVAVDDEGRGGFLLSPEVLLRHRVAGRLGYTIGVGLFASAHSVRDDITEGTYAYYAGGAQASAGLTFRIKTGWHAELRAIGQIGRGTLVFTPEDDDEDDTRGDSGRYRALGGLGALAYTLPIGLELAGHLGWQDVEGRSEFAGTGIRAEGRGLVSGVSVGYVF